MSEGLKTAIERFYLGYRSALQLGGVFSDGADLWFRQFVELIHLQHVAPYTFHPFHERIRYPFDYYTFGNQFLLPLVDRSRSRVVGHPQIEEILLRLNHRENVILLANHQTEPDPQAISVLLDPLYPGFAEQIIFVAGNRVITDPLAIPFSMGRNLLCIYSKKYIDHPPEQKSEKQYHNKKTMERMSVLLQQGGKCIYVAPSGGRDRKDEKGGITVAPFDPDSIEMFYLMAQKSRTATFFYPLTLATYDLFPPPEQIRIEIGEDRTIRCGPIHLSLGPCIDMEQYPGSQALEKESRRKARADHIWQIVATEYRNLCSL